MSKYSNAAVYVWGKGFHYTLANGYTLSVAFGPGNYCSNRMSPTGGWPQSPRASRANASGSGSEGYQSSDFEVAVFDPSGDFVPLGEESFELSIGWVPAIALPKLMQALTSWPIRDNQSCLDSPGMFHEEMQLRCGEFRQICESYQDKVDREREGKPL